MQDGIKDSFAHMSPAGGATLRKVLFLIFRQGAVALTENNR